MDRDWLAISREGMRAIKYHRPVCNPMEMASVMDAVVAESGIPKDLLIGPRRTRGLVEVRHIAMKLIRDLCPHKSYPQIGRFMQRDHTGVLHGCRRAAHWIATDRECRELYRRALRRLIE